MLKPLLRTIPNLSGNVKLACDLSDYKTSDNITFETKIRYARLLPVSSQMRQINIQANLIGSTWEYDLKRFYSQYSEIFFSNEFSVPTSEMLFLNKTKDNYVRNTDFEYGVKRVSYIKNGSQFACFAPIYIEGSDDIPNYFLIKIDFKSKQGILTKYVKVNIKSDINSRTNYIYNYLYRYASSIDGNMVFLNPNNNSATYYGIDLNNGGFIKKVDSRIQTIFNTVLPIQEFDYLIGKGFERNKICVKQILPLSFYINIDNILSEKEKAIYCMADIIFSGNYYDDNDTLIDWFDFSFDYDNYTENILYFNQKTGIMGYTAGYSSNIMNEGFPALNDCNISNYQFSNKLTTTYSRWKLKYSDDKHPYITNLSWAFSNNQNNNYKYREFPTSFVSQTGIALAESDSNGNYHYNLIYPIGDTNIRIYEAYNTLSDEKYKNIMNNYCLSWFEMVDNKPVDENNINISLDNDNLWKDVVDDKVYYNGILYDLTNIYNEGSDITEKIDKFGVFTYIDTSEIKEVESIHKLKFTNYALIRNDIENVLNPNCSTFHELCYHAGMSDNYLYNTYNSADTDLIKYNNIFEENTYGYFIEAGAYNGLDYYELNKYYNAVDLTTYIENCKNDMLSGNNAYIMNQFTYTAYAIEASNIVFSNTNININEIVGYTRIDEYKSYSFTYGDNANNICIFNFNSKDIIQQENPFVSSYIYTDIGYEISNNLFIVNENYTLSYAANQHYEDKNHDLGNVSIDSMFTCLDSSKLSTNYANLLLYKNTFINSHSINALSSYDFVLPSSYISKDYNRNAYLDYTCKQVLDIYKNTINTYISNNTFYEYTYNPELQLNKSIYAKNVFTKTLYCGRLYENDTLAYNIERDKNVLYISKYNLSNLFENYEECNFKKELFFARALNKNYINAWYHELYKDEFLNTNKYNTEWYKHIFVQQKILLKTKYGIEAKYKYINVTAIWNTYIFQDFYKSISFNESLNTFTFKNTDITVNYDKYPYTYFDLYIFDDYVRIDKDIWNKINIDGSDYKDFYIYRPYEIAEYDKKFYSKLEEFNNEKSLFDTIRFEKSEEDNDLIYYADTDNALTPMYNDYYLQDKEETVIYEHWRLDDIWAVRFGDIINYRYNKNNSVMMIQVSQNDINILTELLGFTPVRYINYSDKERYSLVNDIISVDGYNKKSKINVFKANGKIYGYYLINILLDNTYDTFNLRGNIDINNTDTLSDDIENNNLKFIRYINGVDIIQNKEYLTSEFKRYCPFTYISIIKAISELNTYNKPSIFNLKILYDEEKLNISNGSSEVSIFVGDENFIQQKEILQRYMNSIVPYIIKTDIIPNLYYRKLKNVKMNLLDSGKFNSIGDSILYKLNSSINDFYGYKVYTDMSNDCIFWDNPSLEHKSYNCVSEIYYPQEYKYYNCSRMVNLPVNINIELENKYTYDEIIALETTECTFNAFVNYFKNIKQFTDKESYEILFLYNKYNVEYNSVAAGTNITNSVKLYKLTYKFNLL